MLSKRVAGGAVGRKAKDWEQVLAVHAHAQVLHQLAEGEGLGPRLRVGLADLHRDEPQFRPARDTPRFVV